jgi:DNA-nicking Smr family endonuclease
VSDDNDNDNDDDNDDNNVVNDVATIPELTDELDLHTFLPKECADVVEEYLYAAQHAGFATVRIIHGKGVGTLRRIVQAVLERHTAVDRFEQADANWGATRVHLKPA